MNRRKWKVGQHSRLRLAAKLAEEVGEAVQEVGNFCDAREKPQLVKTPVDATVKQLRKANAIADEANVRRERQCLERLVTELEHVEFIARVLREQTLQELTKREWA